MKSYHLYFLLAIALNSVLAVPVTDSNSLIISSTEPTKEDTEVKENVQVPEVNPQIYAMQIDSNVTNRFARTLVTSKVRNLDTNAQETTFSVILPENAFISEFEMEIKGKIYKAYVKEKEEAKQIYQQAVARGQSAAHVEQSARDSKVFTVSVNIEPRSKTIFRLIYEELLQRQLGQYELIINIHPGQTVDDLGVKVHINESRPLTFVRTPSLRTGNEISKNDEKLDPSADIENVDPKSAIVKFSPDVKQQKQFAENLGSSKEQGLAGQFVVQYDVDRDPQGGEVLVRDGYFVHFFAPSELKPLPKHVVFVLDHSGSMSGRKIDQLIEAMKNILSELHSDDLFSIVRFANIASVWDSSTSQFVSVDPSSDYGNLEPHLKEANLPEAANVTEDNVKKAKAVIDDRSDMGLTNIIAGLEVGLFLTKRTQERTPNKYQSMVIFLTDGYPNVGMRSGPEITKTVTKLNSGNNRAAIFSLSFGDSADKDFLRDLSSKNLGFSRHIYEASDSSLQLQDFYKQISSPLLSDVNFKYVDGVSEVTKIHYPIYFRGSELVVAGKIDANPTVRPTVVAICPIGPITFNTTRTEPVTSLERLWAYLTVKQLLKEKESEGNTTESTKKALDLALKYSFVTSITSLVVVKPNETNAVDSKISKPVGPQPQNVFNGIPSSRMPTGMPGMAIPMFSSSSALSGPHGSYQHMSSFGGYAPRRMFQPHLRTDGDTSLIIGGRPGWSGMLAHTTRRTVIPQQTSTTPFPSTTDGGTSPSNATVPQWLESLKATNEITTPQGKFKLGQGEGVMSRPFCPKTPVNGTGVCTILFDCPQMLPLLKDLDHYLQYFCPYKEYAGVCCPVK